MITRVYRVAFRVFEFSVSHMWLASGSTRASPLVALFSLMRQHRASGRRTGFAASDF
jgi:hypothetical protein